MVPVAEISRKPKKCPSDESLCPGGRARWRVCSRRLLLSSLSATRRGPDSTYTRWFWWVNKMVVAAMTMVGNHDDDTDWLDAGLQRFHNLAGSSLADRPLPPPARCLRLLQRRRLRCPGSLASSSHFDKERFPRIQDFEIFSSLTSRRLLWSTEEKLRPGFYNQLFRI